MERRLLILLGSAFALMLSAATEARASFVPWYYNWEPGSSFVSSTTGTGRIYTSDEPLGHAQGSTNVVVTNLRTASTASRGHPDVFTNAGFSATLTIVDGLNGQRGTVTFTGVFNGTISAGSSHLTFTLTGPRVQTLVLGNDVYTITLGRYAPPGPPGSQNSGSIAAFVSVRDAALAPEPPTALLACLGASCLGLASWRRWKRGKPGFPAAEPGDSH
jgi:hypothetical protein